MTIDFTNAHNCPRCRRCITDLPLCKWCTEAVRLRQELDLLEERQQWMVEASVLKKLQTRLDFLAEAARAVIVRWDSIDWKDAEHTGVVIDRLRKALHATDEPAESEAKP